MHGLKKLPLISIKSVTEVLLCIVLSTVNYTIINAVHIEVVEKRRIFVYGLFHLFALIAWHIPSIGKTLGYEESN